MAIVWVLLFKKIVTTEIFLADGSSFMEQCANEFFEVIVR